MLYIVIIVLLTVVDQVVKYVMMNVSGGQIGYSIPVIKNFFHFSSGLVTMFSIEVLLFSNKYSLNSLNSSDE